MIPSEPRASLAREALCIVALSSSNLLGIFLSDVIYCCTEDVPSLEALPFKLLSPLCRSVVTDSIHHRLKIFGVRCHGVGAQTTGYGDSPPLVALNESLRLESYVHLKCLMVDFRLIHEFFKSPRIYRRRLSY